MSKERLKHLLEEIVLQKKATIEVIRDAAKEALKDKEDEYILMLQVSEATKLYFDLHNSQERLNENVFSPL